MRPCLVSGRGRGRGANHDSDEDDPLEEPTQPLVNLVKCPVCNKLPSIPVFGCTNGHIVCEQCIHKVAHCPVCRAQKFNVRNLIVEDILKGRNLQCEYCEDGRKFTATEYNQHQTVCSMRPVECNCKIKNPCTANFVPRQLMERHMRVHHGMTTETTPGTVSYTLAMPYGFQPRKFEAFNHQFMLQSYRQETEFFTWIAELDGDGEESTPFYCKISLYYDMIVPHPPPHEHRYRVERVKIDSEKSLWTLPLHHTPTQVSKSGQCLHIKNDEHNNLPPHIWPGFLQVPGEQPQWGYEIELWKGNPHRRGIAANYASNVSSGVSRRSQVVQNAGQIWEYEDEGDFEDEQEQLLLQQQQQQLIQLEQQHLLQTIRIGSLGPQRSVQGLPPPAVPVPVPPEIVDLDPPGENLPALPPAQEIEVVIPPAQNPPENVPELMDVIPPPPENHNDDNNDENYNNDVPEDPAEKRMRMENASGSEDEDMEAIADPD